MKAKPPPGSPYVPPPYGKAEIGAIQALHKGIAEPHQQQRAINWIIWTLCGTYEPSFMPHSARETDFAEGKRFVGCQLAKAINLNLADIKST